MNKNLFVGNFPFETTQEELYNLFKEFGVIYSVKVLMDRETGRSRGIGFVVMEKEEGAKAAVEKMNGFMLGGRKMFVVEAKPKDGEGKPEAKQLPPGFVERRSGKDRRSGQDRRGGARPPSAQRREEPFKKPWVKRPDFKKKPWGDKPGFPGKPAFEKKPWGSKPAFGDKKKWEKRPPFERKPWGKPAFGEKKPWEKRPPFGKKPWGKPGEGKPERKSWGDKPAFGDKKKWDKRTPNSWERKPWAGHAGPKKKWDKPGFGKKKPAFDKKKPWLAKPAPNQKPKKKEDEGGSAE